MRLGEIQRTPSEGPVDVKDRPRQVKLPAGMKPVPGAPGLGYFFQGGKGQIMTVFTGASHKLWLYDLKQSAVIGWLALTEYGNFPLPKSFRETNVLIYDAYRGQGLGQSLYGVAIKVLGMTIVADDTQTPEARRLWANLHGIPGVSIRGWISFMAQDVMPELDPYDMNNTRSNQRRLARLQGLSTPGPMNPPQSELDTVYFDFPVQSGPNSQELQAAEKFAAIYTKYHPDDNRREYDVGLYARWTGQ